MKGIEFIEIKIKNGLNYIKHYKNLGLVIEGQITTDSTILRLENFYKVRFMFLEGITTKPRIKRSKKGILLDFGEKKLRIDIKTLNGEWIT